MGAISEITEEEEANLHQTSGAPELPSEIADVAGKTTDQLLEELSNNPFFMENYDPSKDDGTNAPLEALKAMKEEGTPVERAEGYKEQGNICYKRKQYREALENYTDGIEVDCEDNYTEAALYVNRAACNLALKNYGRCISDCQECLKRQPKNVKACYRAGSAMFELGKYDDAIKVLQFALQCDSKNGPVQKLLKKVQDTKQKIADAQRRKEEAETLKRKRAENLQTALKLRAIQDITTDERAQTPDGSKIHLEDPDHIESQLIIPTTVVYPTTEEFDFVSEVSELSTPLSIMEVVLDRPEEYFEDPKHANFKPKKLEAYLETMSGGLIKAGKKLTINKLLSEGHAPVFDGILRIYFVPKVESQDWISTWNKTTALSKRAHID